MDMATHGVHARAYQNRKGEEEKASRLLRARAGSPRGRGPAAARAARVSRDGPAAHARRVEEPLAGGTDRVLSAQ